MVERERLEPRAQKRRFERGGTVGSDRDEHRPRPLCEPLPRVTRRDLTRRLEATRVEEGHLSERHHGPTITHVVRRGHEPVRHGSM